ncbi:hypothetical protein SLEP1_g52113 [Rubroshorea leprosula]|uniref:Uncharacterized protein n=1 Tax=Rubroshorea leprosula TaxID=152421 RepID=A0AAV5M8M3_9ROSI|nr:hypothetical protein SLEP1_g52113 [Rubroshorea leprosula]
MARKSNAHHPFLYYPLRVINRLIQVSNSRSSIHCSSARKVQTVGESQGDKAGERALTDVP